jgi:hypothetical protein
MHFKIFLAGMKAQWDEGGGRVMLIRFQRAGLWISA